MGAIKSIIQLDANGSGYAKVIGKKKRKKKKKGLVVLRPAEWIVRRIAKAQQRGLKKYLNSHERSNCKRKDGWLIEFTPNMAKANLKIVETVLKI